MSKNTLRASNPAVTHIARRSSPTNAELGYQRNIATLAVTKLVKRSSAAQIPAMVKPTAIQELEKVAKAAPSQLKGLALAAHRWNEREEAKAQFNGLFKEVSND